MHTTRSTRRRTRVQVLGALAAAAALVAGGSGADATAAARGATTAGGGHGTVQVLYCGSLQNLMEHDLGPKFSAATGYQYRGVGGGSTELAHQIKSKVRQADVFVSADPKVNNSLEGAAGGDWVSWYATFGSAPVKIAYNPHSSFANELKTKPWYQVITEPGFRLGRTDPKLDPKGELSVQALQQASRIHKEPGLVSSVEKSSQVFPEQELDGRLQSGQLDAAFYYSNEATEQHLPTVDLGAVKVAAHFTVTVLNRAANPAGATAFVHYLLGDQGKAGLTAHNVTLSAPTVSGNAAAVPAELRSDLSAKPAG
ncbi:extracellular solute-binding protein [Streptomyces sp. NPDC002514]|uniref:extracellular solute-binding protein n=1 Tax=Streptomyces sp. NPDC001270 TaxID=3364554 RepID=UPI003681D3B3